MAIDIMNSLVQFLCPTSQSAMACNQFINTPHHQVLAPIGPLLYFFLFPTIFLIIFIYILSTSVLRGPAGTIKGIRMLIAVAVYIFIIINGWYSIVLPLSELWFILLPLLGLLYFIVRHFRGEGGGGGGRPAGAMSALGIGGISGLLKRKLSGEEKATADTIEAEINLLRGMEPGAHGIDDVSGRIASRLQEFFRETKILGTHAFSDYKRLFKTYRDVCKKKGLPEPKHLEPKHLEKEMKKAA